MKTIVVYDSQYGNTEKIARAIAHGIKGKAVRVGNVSTTDMEGVGLLVVGSPTQGGRPTKAVAEFLANLDGVMMKGIKAAAFDTGFDEKDLGIGLKLLVKTIGYAAPKIGKALEKKGAVLATPPRTFIVKGQEGPLADGEIESAGKWLKV